MAGEILKLLAEYGKTLAPINAAFIVGKPTDKSQIYTALDKIDPIKLMQNPNPNVTAKAALLETYLLPMEKVDYITEFIYKLNVEADQLIQTLNNITMNFTVEYLEILKDLTAVVESIARNLLSLINMILYWTLLLVLQIFYHIVVDIFQTILNLVLMSVWVTYASLFFTPDITSLPDMHAPLNGAMILAVLIPWQVLILILYLVYIDLMIAQYITNYVNAILLLADQTAAILSRRAIETVILFERALEQVSGQTGSIILMLSVVDSKAKGTAVLTSQLINPLPI